MKAPKQSQTKSQSRRTIRRMTATARRGHGEGSVYRDAANGTWVGAISLGRRPDAGLKTSASYTVAKAVDDWAAEALDGLADKPSGQSNTRPEADRCPSRQADPDRRQVMRQHELLSGLGQYRVDAGLIFGQSATPGRVCLPLALSLRLAYVPRRTNGFQEDA